MAIDCYGFKNIKNVIDIILKKKNDCNVLLLGYADILLTKEELNIFLPDNVIDNLASRDDSLDVAAMYHKEELVDWCCETYSLFENLGCNLNVFDFTAWSGKEEIVDLNNPINVRYKDKYDLIIDSGTTEHIFNISQAMSNILNMAKVGGYICHTTPFNDPNHGFYSFSPTFYIDFYDENGAELISCNLTQTDCNAEEVALPPREVFKFEDGMMFVIAKKHTPIDNIGYPIQGRYKSSSLEDSKSLLYKYKDFNNIVLIPHNGQSKNLKNIFQNKNITILDDNQILIKYSDIEPVSSIADKEFDIILITSITFEDKIREKLEKLGIPKEKIKLQY